MIRLFNRLPLPVREMLKLFVTQLFAYCICCISYRAMAQGRYAWTFCTDIMYGTTMFYVIRRVGETKTKLGAAGYIVGGACGSQVAIWVTKRIFGM